MNIPTFDNAFVNELLTELQVTNIFRE